MSQEDAYGKTIDRLEPEIAAVDASAYYASAAISLKRQADIMEAYLITFQHLAEVIENRLTAIELNTRPGVSR